MQLLREASESAGVPISEDTCARELLDAVPLVMRVIRRHMCRHRSGLTVPQFRTLCFLSTAAGSSLSAVADFIGLSLPAMSRLVDGLVEVGLIERRPCDDDRRHVRLSVTVEGDTAVREARQLAQAQLAEAVAHLTPRQQAAVISTMHLLRDVFSPELHGPGGGDAAVADCADRADRANRAVEGKVEGKRSHTP
jgi:MarR family transcriptional regulator for hemolysin